MGRNALWRWQRQFTPGALVSGLLLVETAKNDAFEKLWDLQVLGSAAWSGHAGDEGTEGKVRAVCVHTYFLCLWSFTWDDWRWKHMIKSSFMQCSPADGGPRASCLKRLIALPIVRWVL